MRDEIDPADVGQLEALLDYAQRYYRRRGYSTSDAYNLAVETVREKTGAVPKDYRDSFNAPRQSTRTSSRTSQSSHGTEYDRMFQNGNDRNAARTSGKILSSEEIRTRERQIVRDLIEQGAHPDYARQQGEQFMIREYGKRARAKREAARSSSDCNCNEKAARSDPSWHGASRARYSGSKCDVPEERYESSRKYTREELLVIWEKIYDDLIEKGIHPDEAMWEARTWFERHKDRATNSSSRGSSSGGSSESSHASHGHRAGTSVPPKRKGPGFHSYFSTEPEEYVRYPFRRGPRDYHTEERRPRGASSNSHNSYKYHSGWSDFNEMPYTQPSGVKPDKDLYELLGVSKSATVAEIKQAHRKQSIKHHPDRVQGGPWTKKAATEKMAQINQACDVLKDKDMRAFYDRTGLIASMGESPDV